jgi:hypothetical protein
MKMGNNEVNKRILRYSGNRLPEHECGTNCRIAFISNIPQTMWNNSKYEDLS